MELIRISERKLKITLTPSDMCQFHLNPEHLEKGSIQMRQAFRLLFAEIRKQIDFDTDDRHISVQYFPSREGGCEMFISHPSTDEERAVDTERLLATGGKSAPAMLPAKQNCGKYRKECAYAFSSVEHLLQACLRLQKAGYIGESTLWKDERGIYYLLLEAFSASPFHTPEKIAFLSEYGSTEFAGTLRTFLKEHGTLLCPACAVERLASCG